MSTPHGDQRKQAEGDEVSDPREVDMPTSKESTSGGLIDQTNYVPTRKVISIFFSCATIGFIAYLDETMIAVALPLISSELGGGNQIAWVGTSYFITSTSFQLVCGRLSDIWSRKTVLFVLMIIFSLGNIGSAFSNTFVQLLVFRAIAGIGGGGMPTIGQVIVSDTVSLRERGKYQGILGASVALAYGIGPVIGGAFVESSTWRWIFRLLLPLTAISAACCYFFMPLKQVDSDWKVKLRRVDFMGSFLVLAGSTLIVMALTWGGGTYAWNDAHVVAPLCIGTALAVAFVLWEGFWPKYPLLPLYIFRQRIVIGAAITHFINGYLTMVQVFYIPAFYQLAYGYSPVKSAALMLTLTVVQTITSSLSGLIITRTGRYRELILIGWVVWTVGLGLFSTLTPSSSLAKQVGYSLLTGFGVGQTMQPSLVAVQGAVDRTDMAVVTAMRSFVRNIGGTLGLAISGTLLTNIFFSNLQNLELDPEMRGRLVDNPLSARKLISEPSQLSAVVVGYRRGFWVIFIIMTALASAAFLFSLFLLNHSSLKRDDDERLKMEAKERLASSKA
ncbi:mfs drug transporter [Moniliophthora roreri MCA 2997]|uniref:Mfs drug transporter n=1 Tax=Moniliophthora roreri (strain MCA 2997) TaxID=1381753 RepID=V2XSC7_MONRO|nr:mfs drug transporter [Moniliophthora roreri MCA 2997]